ncbi:polysaccharide biosynthesis protein [Aerococcaceae bacterium NML210727]|nr:polysaccharide biosynthesis protein [Aerococcaceae bacterium NML210727]
MFEYDIEHLLVDTVEKLNNRQKQMIWNVLDLCVFLASTTFSYLFFYLLITPIPHYYFVHSLLMFVVYLLIRKGTRQSTNMNRYSHTRDFVLMFSSVVISSLTSAIICNLFWGDFSYRFVVLSTLLSILLILAPRILWQMIYLSRPRRKNANSNKRNILLIGAGAGGAAFMDSYHRNPGDIEVVGIIDRDPQKKGRKLRGVEVFGYAEAIPQILESHPVSEAIIAIPSLSPEEYVNILNMLNPYQINIYKMPKVEDVMYGNFQQQSPFKKVEIADLLGRKEVRLDESCLQQELGNKTILVTGAGGSIGSEICRQVLAFAPKCLILLGHGENSIYSIYHELLKQQSTAQIIPVIADIQDYQRIVAVFQSHPIDIVYHAAAHKHVPLMEMNPTEALKNNIIGTYNVAKAVDVANINKMVLISSDKAVNPPNVMGATKRIAELIVTGFGQRSQSTFCAVRFGNVLGSSGSVIPLFESQIKEGGPITVTDFNMTRYFMTIPEASRLVIHAGAYAKGGEVFVLDMGEPVKIVDLARKLILLSGHTEAEIEIVESGIRPGEKLFEELLLNSESVERQVDSKIFVGKVEVAPLETTEAFIKELQATPEAELKQKIIAFANRRAL